METLDARKSNGLGGSFERQIGGSGDMFERGGGAANRSRRRGGAPRRVRQYSSGAVTSIYRWKGKVESAKERLLLIKTSRKRLAKLRAAVERLHSYEVPEFIALPIVAGSREYLAWIEEVPPEGIRLWLVFA